MTQTSSIALRTTLPTKVIPASRLQDCPAFPGGTIELSRKVIYSPLGVDAVAPVVQNMAVEDAQSH